MAKQFFDEPEVKHLYDRVLVATDGSGFAEIAIEHAVHIAKACNSILYAVYVVDKGAYEDRGPSSGSTDMVDLLRKKGREAIKKAELEGELHKLEVKGSVVEGHPAEEIIKFARDNQVDLIVVGRLGKTGISRYLIGSVADKVVKTSPVPVLVIKK